MSIAERPRSFVRPTRKRHYNSLPKTSLEGALVGCSRKFVALPWCCGALSALANIHSPHTGVCCVRYVAQLTPREGAGQLPALLRDQGALPSSYQGKKGGSA